MQKKGILVVILLDLKLEVENSFLVLFIEMQDCRANQ